MPRKYFRFLRTVYCRFFFEMNEQTHFACRDCCFKHNEAYGKDSIKTQYSVQWPGNNAKNSKANSSSTLNIGFKASTGTTMKKTVGINIIVTIATHSSKYMPIRITKQRKTIVGSLFNLLESLEREIAKPNPATKFSKSRDNR